MRSLVCYLSGAPKTAGLPSGRWALAGTSPTRSRARALDAVRAALSACLARDPQWVERSRRALAEIRYAGISDIRPEAVAARGAFGLAAAGQTRAAADRLQQAINDLEDPALRGWIMEQKAAYLHLTDPAAAQRLLASAIQENEFVLRPSAGIAPAPGKPAAVQARAAAAFLASEYKDGLSLVLGVKFAGGTPRLARRFRRVLAPGDDTSERTG